MEGRKTGRKERKKREKERGRRMYVPDNTLQVLVRDSKSFFPRKKKTFSPISANKQKPTTNK